MERFLKNYHPPHAPTIVTAPPPANQKQLMTLSKKDLVERCESLQLDARGTKFDLVKRLLCASGNTVLQTIVHQRPVVSIEKDCCGHYVHRDTLLVFDPVQQVVTGKKHSARDETVLPLDYQDIQNCLRFKFQYRLPDNLADTDHSKEPSSSYHDPNTDEVFHKRLLEIKDPVRHNEDDDDDDESVGDDGDIL